MIRYLILAAAASVAAALPAQAITVQELVAEAATNEMAAAMPENGSFDVRMLSLVPEGPVGFKNFDYDMRSGRFRGRLFTETGKQADVLGTAILTVDVPVPARRIDEGEILTDADFTTVALPAMQVGGMVVRDGEDLVGQEARRVLAPGRPVMDHAVGAPIVAEKGNRVEIVFRRGAMTVSAPGRLLENGSEGEDVKVVNVVSNRRVVGLVVDADTVEVSH